MQTLSSGYRGLSLIVELNLDRFLMVSALIAALVVGGIIGSL